MGISVRRKLDIFIRDNFICYICNRKVYYRPIERLRGRIKSDEATVDHIVPKIKGGSDLDDNLKTCCYKCNCKKGRSELFTLSTEEYLIAQEIFSEVIMLHSLISDRSRPSRRRYKIARYVRCATKNAKIRALMISAYMKECLFLPSPGVLLMTNKPTSI